MVELEATILGVEIGYDWKEISAQGDGSEGTNIFACATIDNVGDGCEAFRIIAMGYLHHASTIRLLDMDSESRHYREPIIANGHRRELTGTRI